MPLEIACVGPQFSVNTHANVDMTQFPNRLIIAPTVPIDMSGLPVNVGYDLVEIQLNTQPSILIRGLHVGVSGLQTRIDALTVLPMATPIQLEAEQGEISASLEATARQNDEANRRKPNAEIQRGELPSFHFRWTNASIQTASRRLGTCLLYTSPSPRD